MNREFLEALKIPETIRIPFLGGKWYQYLTKLENKSIREEALPENPLNTEKREKKIIATLTTYPARINCVHLAIKSIMLQTYKPDRIILWLADSQFPNRVLPKELTDLENLYQEKLKLSKPAEYWKPGCCRRSARKPGPAGREWSPCP